jgi:protein associated with RNAse G/E
MRPVLSERRVRVLSTKYDGSPHNDYVAMVLGSDAAPDLGAPLRLFVPVGTIMRSTARADFALVTPFTQLFWPGADVWWNIEHMHWPHVGTNGGVMYSYANVSLPARLEGDTVHWVDLDLDIVTTDRGPVLVDEDEFEEHRVRFGYPDDLVARAHEAAATLLERAALGTPPWDRDAHIWETPSP